MERQSRGSARLQISESDACGDEMGLVDNMYDVILEVFIAGPGKATAGSSNALAFLPFTLINIQESKVYNILTSRFDTCLISTAFCNS